MSKTRLPFKVIGLRVLENCDEQLRKILKPETTYFFCNDYEDDGKGCVKRKAYCDELSPNFFNLHSKDKDPLVSISCVVGHNGEGKSSLIELLIRTINNFAYLSGFRSDYPNLKFIQNLHAVLYFLSKDKICSISCLGEKACLTIGGEKYPFLKDEDKNGREKKKSVLVHAHYLFHTLVSNYSLYAYNANEFIKETSSENVNDSWLTALFSKNDAYQTPIILMPQRQNGIIDVNRMYSLSVQRLAELFLDCKKGKFKIRDSEWAEGFVYRLESQSKLLSKTIQEYLLKNKGNNTIRFDVKFVRNKYSIDFNNETVLKSHIDFWEKLDNQFFDSSLLDITNNLNAETEHNYEYPTKEHTDFGSYLAKIRYLVRQGNYKSPIAMRNVNLMIGNGGGKLNFIQFQRLYLVFEICKRWARELKLDIDSCFPLMFSENDPKNHAFWYLVYKTIKVLEIYPDYFSGGLADYEIPQHFFNNKVRDNNINNWFKHLLDDIKKNESHITLKIRQTLYFLRNAEVLLPREQTKKIPEAVKVILALYNYKYYMDFENYYKRIKGKRELANAIPPPIFEMDYLISQGDHSYYPLSRMSSGERQLLNSVSAIVYHLKNIAQSSSKGTKITYQNVNVILEEVELYFHPEYQRRFVQYLLEQISNAHLPAEMSINLLFVTHSPFILSDIPRQNVLFLKEGNPDRSMQEDTFGANIHTLLQNGFFLNSVPIGAFAKEKISQMFTLLNQSGGISDEDLNLLEKEIPLVSEPLLRGQLMRLYSMRKKFEFGDYQEKITTLENRIRYLEERLNDKN